MRTVTRFRHLAAIVLLAAAGCGQSNAWTRSRVDKLSGDYAALAAENQRLRRQAGALDRNDEQQTQLFAQAQRETQRDVQLLREQLSAVREQLKDSSTQLARSREEKLAAQKKVDALLASTRRGGGATIKANNSLKNKLPAVNIPDVYVRADVDVVRVEIPADKLFSPGKAELRGGAAQLIESVARQIAREYPNQLIGIEGHTDNRPVGGAGWTSNHQLSLARAIVVFDRLVAGKRLAADQLMVVGHGPNHPIFSNAHPDGQARNRRIELVIYPERPAGRG